MLELGRIFNIVSGLGGEVRQVKFYSRLARVKLRKVQIYPKTSGCLRTKIQKRITVYRHLAKSLYSSFWSQISDTPRAVDEMNARKKKYIC